LGHVGPIILRFELVGLETEREDDAGIIVGVDASEAFSFEMSHHWEKQSQIWSNLMFVLFIKEGKS